jgi:hypothetical protein
MRVNTATMVRKNFSHLHVFVFAFNFFALLYRYRLTRKELEKVGKRKNQISFIFKILEKNWNKKCMHASLTFD